jgi:hypothetical protein
MNTFVAGFEAYEVRAWVRDGLIVRPAEGGHARRPSRRSRKWVVAVALSAAALALPDRTEVLAQAALHWDSVAPRTRTVGLAPADGVPDGYWRDLMTKMRQWKATSESPLSGPEPIV